MKFQLGTLAHVILIVCNFFNILSHWLNYFMQIQRVQNKSLYQQFKAKGKELDLHNPNKSNEKRLFHGSDPNTIDLVSRNGFSRNYAGKNGK